MFFKTKKEGLIRFQAQKFNVDLVLKVLNNGEFAITCGHPAFIQDLIEVFMILKFEGHMEFVDLVNEKKDAGYQDFLIFFTDGVVEYYLGAPAGQVSEPLFFEILVYFLGTAREYEKANKIFEKHLSKLPESPYIKSNLEKIISEISAHKI